MAIRIIYSLISTVFSLYELALMAYVILSWVNIPANRWTELLRRIIEPVLTPIRRLLMSKLPARFQMLDWSPMVLLLLIGLARRIVAMILTAWIW